MSGDRERSLHAGMNEHLTKPIKPAVLRDALMRWMPAKQVDLPQPKVTPASFEDEIPEQLLPFDIQAAIAGTNGKPKLLRKMLQGFHDQYTNAVSELRLQVAEGRVDEANRLAHSLKGVAAMLEAKKLSATAATVEYALRDGRIEGLGVLLDTMEKALNPALAAASSLNEKTNGGTQKRPLGDLQTRPL